jgi:hypothetical protein
MSSASLIPSSFSSTTMSLRTRLPHRSDYGVGAGTGISGFRANLGVGDDLFGSREDAIRCLVELHGGGILHEKATDLRVHNNPDGKYLIKGGGPKVWRKFRLRKEHRRLQGLIVGKRCGTTENIGAAARRRCRENMRAAS